MAPRLDPFRESHALRYGLEVVARDAATNDATSVLCLFCRHYGREERPGKKRKATPNFKYFHAFRSDLYSQHLRSQHPTLWEKYKCSKDDVKLLFFPKDLTRPEPDKQKLSDKRDVVEAAVAAKSSQVEQFCWFLIPKRLVDLTVPSAILGGDRRWQPPTFRACEVVDLTRQEAEGVQDGVTQGHERDREKYYQVALFLRMELDVALDALAAGLSPRQASLHLAALARRMAGAGAASPAFPLLTTETIREIARLVMSESMKLTGQLLARSWSFGLVLREVTAAPALPRAGYLDCRVVVYAQGKLRDIHVIALPLFERHAALGLAQAIETVLDAVFPPWRTRVLGITQDGCAGSGMGADQPVSADQLSALSPLPTHRSSEVLSYLETSIKASTPASPRRALYRTWRAYDQVSLALKSFYDSLLGGRFLPVMRSLMAYIRQNPVLLRVMGHPPSVMVGKRDEASTLNASIDLTVSAEGLAVGIDAQWITDKRVRLRKYLEQNSAPDAVVSSPSSSAIGACTPIDDVWWIAFFVVHWVAARANEAFENLLLRRVSRTRQSQVIMELATELMKTFNVKLDQQPEGQELPYFSRQGKFSILKSGVHDFLCDQGTFVTNVANRVNPTGLNAVLESLAICMVNLIEALADLGTSPAESEASSEETLTLPPTLPHEFARLTGREFTTILQHHAELLHAFYSDEELDALEQEYQALHRSATRDSNLKSALADCYEESLFAESWKLTKDQFPLLQAFAGGLASAYHGRDAGSSNSMAGLSVCSSKEEVASDNALRLGATDFVLESSLHAQQFDALSELCRDLAKPSQPSETTDPISTSP